jgi:hypothetical protein
VPRTPRWFWIMSRVAGAFLLTAVYLVIAGVVGARWVDEDRCRQVARARGVRGSYLQRPIWSFPPDLRCEYGDGEVIVDYSLTVLLALLGISGLVVLVVAFVVLGRIAPPGSIRRDL